MSGTTQPIYLGVNIDHVATLRNVRGTPYPSPVEAALLAEQHGADGITAHLREDRRHITDADMAHLRSTITTRLNMEMANTAEMVAIALKIRPNMVTLVPERRAELTTEGGLDVVEYRNEIQPTVTRLQDEGIDVSLFIEGDPHQVETSHQIGARFVEFHTGRYCELVAANHDVTVELERLHTAAKQAVAGGITVNAGHGLTRSNVRPILSLPGLHELNIGHAIIADAVLMGLGPAVAAMKAAMRPET